MGTAPQNCSPWKTRPFLPSSCSAGHLHVLWLCIRLLRVGDEQLLTGCTALWGSHCCKCCKCCSDTLSLLVNKVTQFGV